MMSNISHHFRHVRQWVATLLLLLVDAVRDLGLCLRPSAALAAENLFLRKQLALHQERQVKPRQATNAIRLALVWLSRWFNWRSALSIVTPETFTRWHRQGFRWFWRCQAKPGRPALPKDLQALIRQRALGNPTWGQERIANELLLKLGLKVSSRTVPDLTCHWDLGFSNRLPRFRFNGNPIGICCHPISGSDPVRS